MEKQQQLQQNNPSPSQALQQSNHHLHPDSPQPPPSSSASSPSHEFSFTISLHNKSKSSSISSSSSSNPLTLDLSPADEIFFHGHLLPLHLLSHLPAAVSPRASTNSPLPPAKYQSHTINNPNSSIHQNSLQQNITNSHPKPKSKSKSKSFSIFKTPSNWKSEGKSNPQVDVGSNFDNKKSRFNAVKRFFRLIKLRPGFLSFRSGNNRDEYFLGQQQYSTYSGNLRGTATAARSSDSKMEMRGRKMEYWSAPETMKNSPTNSGVLVASGTVTPTNYKSDSTMEELQAAIQAAIAHCKKSIANEDNRIIKGPCS